VVIFRDLITDFRKLDNDRRKPILDSQTMQEPLLPIQTLANAQGWVLLLGVNQTTNTSIHYGKKLASRKQFNPWALTPIGVIASLGFPGCSDGFEAISPQLGDVIRVVEMGEAVVQAMPLVTLMDTVCKMIKANPVTLLCV
jgi:aminoglycoside 3-N-acetyltransferase